MRLLYITFIATSLASALPQTDQNIPLDEPYCRCMDDTGNSDETLTQAICKKYGGKFAIYDTGNDVYDLQGACFSYAFSLGSTAEFDNDCKGFSGGQCKYFGRCVNGDGDREDGYYC